MGQVFQTSLLNILLTNQKLPSIILLHLEPDEFLGNQQNRDIQNLKYYYNREPKITSELNQLSSFEFLKFSFGLYRFNGRAITLVKNYIQTKTAFKENNGYEPVYRTMRDSLNTLYSANKITEAEFLNFNYRQANYLAEFVSLCNSEGITLICFTSPLFKATARSVTASAVLDSLLAANQVSYINFLVKPIHKLQAHPKYWKDAYHLNHDGAQIESEILAKEIEITMNKTN